MTETEHAEATAWIGAVDEAVSNCPDFVPPPVPVDELADLIREDGELAELPALALLDEIQRLRAVCEAARDVVAAVDACDREEEKPTPSRSSAPAVRWIKAMAALRKALGRQER